MDNKESGKKIKQPKINIIASKNSESRKAADVNKNNEESLKLRRLLLAKDSEWIDISQTSSSNTKSIKRNEEKVECEDGPQIKPLALLFPSLLEKDPEMLDGMLNKVISTTEVTKYLVGQKANFAFMKKVNRLIPTDKKWLESLTENSTSCCSLESKLQDDGLNDFEEGNETTDDNLDS